MKYIFLLGLVVVTSGVGAATNVFDTSGGANSSTGGGSSGSSFEQGGALNDYQPGFGSADNTGQTNSSVTSGNALNSGPLNDYQPFAGSGGLNTTVGGGNGLNTTAGGGGLQELGKPTQTVSGFVIWFLKLLNYVIIALLTCALLFFLYGILVLMFVGGTKEESRSQGRKFMIWGIVSLFVMVSVWGLVGILKTSVFGNGPLTGPQFNTN